MTQSLEQLREQVGRMAGLGSLTSERLIGSTVAALAESAVALSELYGGPRYADQVRMRLEDALASWAINGGHNMAETPAELRERVARDAGLSREVARTWRGENEDRVVEEAYRSKR